MTAGTKAILLLSVLGMIILVVWFGDGPEPVGGNAAEPGGLVDPLLASASASGTISSRSPAASQPVHEPQPPPSWRRPTQPADRSSVILPEAGSTTPPSGSNEPVYFEMGVDLPRELEMPPSLPAAPNSGVESQRPSSAPPSMRGGSASGRSQSNGVRLPVAQPPASWTVAPGDTMGHIAQKVYGSARRWELIARANPGADPSNLRIGQKLVIPKATLVPTRSSIQKNLPPLATGRTWTIGEGETLSSIADVQLGHEQHWIRIYELNKQRIGPDPDRLVVGMVIAVPK